MNKKQLIFGVLFAVGLFMAASFSIDEHGFHSGVYGIVGCVLILVSYAGWNWKNLHVPGSQARKILYLLSAVLALIVVLDVMEIILA